MSKKSTCLLDDGKNNFYKKNWDLKIPKEIVTVVNYLIFSIIPNDIKEKGKEAFKKSDIVVGGQSYIKSPGSPAQPVAYFPFY